MSGTVHVVGAGLAGLSAAVQLATEGGHIVIHEAAMFAGGRCRSYYDAQIGMEIDNGNHLLLSGNRAAFDFLRQVGGLAALTGAQAAEFPFADLATGERWTLRPNPGRLPWWILDSRRRVPGSRAPDYLAPVAVLRARAAATVGEAMDCRGPLYERLWRPVLLAALNTDPAEADAGLAAQILRETLGAGGQACRPFIAAGGLSTAFIEPALAFLHTRGAELHFGRPLRSLRLAAGRAEVLQFGGEEIALGPEDSVVLAVPAQVAPALLPGIPAPQSFHAIVNAHFRVAPPAGQPLFLGVINGLTEWLFSYPDRLSVTISCADRLMNEPRAALAAAIWREVQALTGLADDMPPWQIVRERRATFAATPAEAARRPEARTAFDNVFLAGDWTRTGLPATIEGAVRSGVHAAEALSRAGASARRPRSAA